MTQAERRTYLINKLIGESKNYIGIKPNDDINYQKTMLRGLLNVRLPMSADEDFIKIQNEYLSKEIAQKGITDVDTLEPIEPKIYLWQGDITTLKCDGIVNAANSGLTGCYIPNHRCIDNAIHTFAGVQLRLECDKLIKKQGYPEPIGKAKITRAYNLPCQYVLHTVGPFISGKVTEKEKSQLASCYRSCLELSAKNNLKSVAFCCISTGEFNFPNKLAAEIAVASVREFLTKQTSVRKVIFNVFKDEDKSIYSKLLGTN